MIEGKGKFKGLSAGKISVPGTSTGVEAHVAVGNHVLIDDKVIGREVRISMPESRDEYRAQLFVTNGRFFQIIAVGAGVSTVTWVKTFEIECF